MEGIKPSRRLHLDSLSVLAGYMGPWLLMPQLQQQTQLLDIMCMRLINDGIAEQFLRWVLFTVPVSRDSHYGIVIRQPHYSRMDLSIFSYFYLSLYR